MSEALVPFLLARRVGNALDRCEVPWVVGGSLASSVHGMPRLVLPILSPEDTAAQKLRWFDLGGRTSQRQWHDVLDVLRVQGSSIDVPLLRRLAAELGVAELLDLAVAGGSPRP